MTLHSSWSLKTKQPNYGNNVHDIYMFIQGDSWGNFNIFKVAVSVIMRKCVHTNMCIILNGYRNGAAWISRSRSLRFFFGEVNEKRSLQKKYEYATRFARSYFGCCCSYKGAWRSIQTKKERAILAHKLQSALTLTVWLLKSYCESLLFTNRYTLYQS